MKKLLAPVETQAYRIMTKPVETVRMGDTIRAVAQLFTEKNISAAAVLDQQNRPIGVITKTDIARFQLEEGDVAVVDARRGFHVINDVNTVEHYMTPAIFTVKPDTPLTDVARQMVKYGTHHIFVKGTNGDPVVGVVSSFDILRHLLAKNSNGHAL